MVSSERSSCTISFRSALNQRASGTLNPCLDRVTISTGRKGARVFFRKAFNRPLRNRSRAGRPKANCATTWSQNGTQSEEHTSELQSRQYLVCRLLLEKKKYT